MYAKVFNLLFILLLIVSVPARSQDPGAEKKIKSIIITEEKFDMLINKQYKESETYYDTHGNIIEEISYKEGRVTKHMKYRYDDEGNKIREEELSPSGKLVKVSEYKYANGLRVEKIVYDADMKVKSKKHYVYTTY